MSFVFSAQDICRTRLCGARDCDQDAIIGSALCERCDRRARAGVNVPIHEVPEQLGPQLQCSTCRQWLDDEAFPLRREGQSGYSAARRGRRVECRVCTAGRKRAWRKANPRRRR